MATPATNGSAASVVFDSPLCRPFPNVVRLMKDPARPAVLAEQDLTDAYYTQGFADEHGEIVQYDHRLHAWFFYDEGLWRQDHDGAIVRTLIEYSRRLQRNAPDAIQDLKQRDMVSRFYRRQESARGLESIERLARSLHPLASLGDSWDVQPHLLGTPAGVLNLRHPELPILRDPSLKITRSLGCGYNEHARCPRWLTALDEVFCGRQDLISYVHRALGYTLTGETSEQAFFLLLGGGSNGKSTLLETIAFIMSDYCVSMPFSVFEANARTAIPNDLAMLPGKRFVTASETSDEVRLNEPRIKALTGGDTITARHLHREFFSFKPVCKVWLSTNQMPGVRDRSHGFWRRVRLLPFDAQFDVDGRPSDGLRETLRSEAEGILLWMLEGCRIWYKHGLGAVPEAVTAATNSFAANTDPLAGFLEDACVLLDTISVGSAALLKAYTGWADAMRLGPERLSRNAFYAQLDARFTKKRTNHGASYQGIGLRVTE